MMRVYWTVKVYLLAW